MDEEIRVGEEPRSGARRYEVKVTRRKKCGLRLDLILL